MKRLLLSLALLGSVAANVWLLWDFVRGPAGAPEAPVAVAAPAAVRAAGDAGDPTAQVDRQTWERLTQGGDPAALVARLRAQGFPPKMVRIILTLQLQAAQAERLQDINVGFLSQPYWRSTSNGSMITPAFNLANRALSREVDDRVMQLLGPSLPEMTPEELAEWRNRHGELISPEKIGTLERIAADYSDLRSQVTTAAGRILLPEDREKLAFLEKEMLADMARTLTPEEMTEYEMRTGRTGQALRSTVAAFRPTEQEFRALYRVMQTLDAQFGRSSPQTPEERRQRTEAEAQLGPQIAAVLGPERYADYQRTTDPAWRTAYIYVGLNGLPSALIGPLAGVEQEFAPRARAVRENAALTAEQRNAQLAALAQEAEQRLAATLGAERAAAYKASGGWMRALQPMPAR